jgi:hypothetical protein
MPRPKGSRIVNGKVVMPEIIQEIPQVEKSPIGQP